MRILQTSCILSVVLAFSFAVVSPIFTVSDFHDNHVLELLDTGEENQTEHEESQEELADDDFKHDCIYNKYIQDSSNKDLFERNGQIAYHIFSDPTSPPPEHI